MSRLRKVITAVASLLVIALILGVLQRLVMPKYAGDIPEGNFTAEYYNETTEHDVIMVGDCEVYENIDPMYLWKKFGITSYIRGNAQQLAWQSYYMLEDTLRYEKPKVVIYNVQALSYSEPQREEYNRMTLDGMKWSKTKFDAIKASMCKEENIIDYIFPLLRYHSRALELSSDDFKYFNKRKKSADNGYYMRVDVLPVSESDVADPSWLLGDEGKKSDEESEDDVIDDPWADIEGADEAAEDEGAAENKPKAVKENDDMTFGTMPMKYLDKMRKLCKENDIQFILMKAPSLAPQWYDEQNQQVIDYAEKYNLSYINFYELLDETGIDYETDTYDGGLHMNLSGADKLSEYIGSFLTKEYNIKDHRSDEKISAVYEKKYAEYENRKHEQQKELEK